MQLRHRTLHPGDGCAKIGPLQARRDRNIKLQVVRQDLGLSGEVFEGCQRS